MTDKEIVERAKEAEKRTGFGELVHSPISKGVNSSFGIGFIEGMVEYRNSLQEEPINKDFEMALAEMIDKAQKCVVEPLVIAAQWKDELIKLAKCEEPVSEQNLFNVQSFIKKWKEPVSEEFEEALAREWQGYNDRGAATVDALEDNTQELAFAKGFYRGAKWQKSKLWKPADGNDLPEYEREVVVFTQNFTDDAGMMRVAIGHRPTPEGYDGRSLTTGEVKHYTPITYDKGGWNIPDIVYWLDVELPKEIEL